VIRVSIIEHIYADYGVPSFIASTRHSFLPYPTCPTRHLSHTRRRDDGRVKRDPHPVEAARFEELTSWTPSPNHSRVRQRVLGVSAGAGHCRSRLIASMGLLGVVSLLLVTRSVFGTAGSLGEGLEVSKSVDPCTTQPAETLVLPFLTFRPSSRSPPSPPTTQGGRVYHGADAAPGAAEQDQEPFQVWQG
jgi:hypothetical protein